MRPCGAPGVWWSTSELLWCASSRLTYWYLPQWAAAGYGDGKVQSGTLQIDYSVTRGSGTQWSGISPTYTLNTTF